MYTQKKLFKVVLLLRETFFLFLSWLKYTEISGLDLSNFKRSNYCAKPSFCRSNWRNCGLKVIDAVYKRKFDSLIILPCIICKLLYVKDYLKMKLSKITWSTKLWLKSHIYILNVLINLITLLKRSLECIKLMWQTSDKL